MRYTASALIVLALTGCEPRLEREEYKQEALVQDVQRAICAEEPKVRAGAIASVSAKSEGRTLGEVSQAVDDIASDVAVAGCPAAAKVKSKAEAMTDQFLAERYGVKP